MPRYLLVCTENRRHQSFVERDAWVWSVATDRHYVMPQDALDDRLTPKRLSRFKCKDCGATVTIQDVE